MYDYRLVTTSTILLCTYALLRLLWSICEALRDGRTLDNAANFPRQLLRHTSVDL
jgi:hypothetical protein